MPALGLDLEFKIEIYCSAKTVSLQFKMLKELILNLQDWYDYLLSKWRTIIIFGLLGAIMGFLVANYKKTVYVATSTFVLEDDNSSAGSLGNIGGLASIAGIQLSSGGGIFQGDNII